MESTSSVSPEEAARRLKHLLLSTQEKGIIMATSAMSGGRKISRPQPTLAVYYTEGATCYFGRFLEGGSLFESVVFLKTECRELTEKEVKMWEGKK